MRDWGNLSPQKRKRRLDIERHMKALSEGATVMEQNGKLQGTSAGWSRRLPTNFVHIGCTEQFVESTCMVATDAYSAGRQSSSRQVERVY